MPYIIDGHNLIQKIPGLNLSDLDDEAALIFILDQYFRDIRKKAIVFFDQGNLSANNQHKSAFVQAFFIRPPKSADNAILQYIANLGAEAKNYIVVTSDRYIVDNTLRAGAKTISSEDFSKLIVSSTMRPQEDKPDTDLDYWLDQFQVKS